ncbi:DUF1016 N-terminal domain-containing protein [Arthrobacter sp. B0490]|uniref:DUF1016 N-terminal domain-containing protein n=1 Tax=Arthrobacter sp. B0490 TaxID=2058891 RepID=UPI000CE2D571|nr:DUF1016 N-terminal domain-containing protein [Arthrobacter sp. B0490]
MPTPDDLVYPNGYGAFLQGLKERVSSARVEALRTVNTQLIELYGSIGRDVGEQQRRQGWGSGVIRRLADDLRAEFPEVKGYSAGEP